jgi:hypothetical protein
MKKRSVEAQISILRAAMKWRVGRNLHNWLLGVGVMLAMLGVALWSPIPLVCAAFFAIVGVSERRAAPNLLNALAAYDTRAPSMAEISITITSWDSDDHYHVLVPGQGQPDWEYEFIPQGWSPVAGRFLARIWRLEDNGPPALAIVDEGILIPRYDPKHAGRGM